LSTQLPNSHRGYSFCAKMVSCALVLLRTIFSLFFLSFIFTFHSYYYSRFQRDLCYLFFTHFYVSVFCLCATLSSLDTPPSRLCCFSRGPLVLGRLRLLIFPVPLFLPPSFYTPYNILYLLLVLIPLPRQGRYYIVTYVCTTPTHMVFRAPSIIQGGGFFHPVLYSFFSFF